MRRRKNRREAGFTAVELLMAAAIGSMIITMVFSVLANGIKEQSASLALSGLESLSRQIVQAMKSDAAWTNTVLAGVANGNFPAANMDCLTTGELCTTNGQAAGAPITSKPFALLDAGGALLFDSTNPSNGFDFKGSRCTSFTATGNDSCPLRFELMWSALCSGANCKKPIVLLSAKLRYAASSARVPVNTDNFTFSLYRPFLVSLGGGTVSRVAPVAGGGTTASVEQFQPALAVRGASCLMCHANIQATVVSDFGYGNPFYMDLDKPYATSFGSSLNGYSVFSSLWYSPVPWQSLYTMKGQVVVPKAPVSAAYAQALGLPAAATDLPTLLTSALMKNFGTAELAYWGITNTNSRLSATAAVVPPAGLASVTSAQEIYIGAPNSAQILALAPALVSTGALAVDASGTTSAVTGLTTAVGVKGVTYVTNSGPLQCSGLDIVVNGTLLLNNLNVYAESGGCRLYVTGSVFIEGPITYLNSVAGVPDPTSNLQITSGVSINLGVGLNGVIYDGCGTAGQMLCWENTNDPLADRYLKQYANDRNAEFRAAPDAATYSAWAVAVHDEGMNIGPGLLVDASIPAPGIPMGKSAAGQPRQSINFDHLLLNAPVIHSRYLGKTSGVIIAEIAEFSLGEFYFTYDSVFSDPAVKIFPRLSQDILCVTNTPGKCKPINP